MDPGRTDHAEEVIEEVFGKVKDRIEKLHGSDVWNELLRFVSVRNFARAEYQLLSRGASQGTDLVEDVFDSVLESSAHFLRRAIELGGTDTAASGNREPQAPQGSLNRIIYYAIALPMAIQAREEILAQTAPLSRDDSVAWLVAQIKKRTPIEWVSMRINLKMYNDPGIFEQYQDAIGRGENAIDAAIAALETARMGNGVTKAHVSRFPVPLPNPSGGSKRFLAASTPELLALSDWAYRIAMVIAGWTPSQVQAEAPHMFLDEPFAEIYDDCVWFILGGKWPLSFPRWSLSLAWDKRDCDSPDFFLPVLGFRPLSLDLSPQRLAREYADIRSQLGPGGKGRKLSQNAEKVALAALDVCHYNDVWMGERGFTKLVVARAFARGAEFPGRTPAAKTVDRILRRIEGSQVTRSKRRFGRLASGYPRSLFSRTKSD